MSEETSKKYNFNDYISSIHDEVNELLESNDEAEIEYSLVLLSSLNSVSPNKKTNELIEECENKKLRIASKKQADAEAKRKKEQHDKEVTEKRAKEEKAQQEAKLKADLELQKKRKIRKIITVIVGILVAVGVIIGISTCVYKAANKYSSNNVTLTITSKQNVESSGSSYSIKLAGSLKNNGSVDITEYQFDVLAMKSNNKIGEWSVYLTGYIKSSDSTTWDVTIESNNKTLWDAKYSELAFQYKTTSIRYSDGTARSYSDDYKNA